MAMQFGAGSVFLASLTSMPLPRPSEKALPFSADGLSLRSIGKLLAVGLARLALRILAFSSSNVTMRFLLRLSP